MAVALSLAPLKESGAIKQGLWGKAFPCKNKASSIPENVSRYLVFLMYWDDEKMVDQGEK